MKKILIAILLSGLICTCAEPPSPEKTYPTELVGVWKSEDNQEDNSWYHQYYPNGKSVGIGITYGKLFAYEAQWWVNKDFIYERVTHFLHTGDFEPEWGEVEKEKLTHLSNKKHTIVKELESGSKPSTYIRISDDPAADKYQKIDRQLKVIQSGLPDYGDDFIWLSAVRDKDKLIWIYQKSDASDTKFNPVEQKKFIIQEIKQDPDIIADNMHFKLIYLLPDDKMSVINISPKEYNNEK